MDNEFIDVNAITDELVANFVAEEEKAFADSIPDEPEAKVEDTEAKADDTEVKSEDVEAVPAVDVDAVVAAKVAEVEAKYKSLLETRHDVKDLTEDDYFKLSGKDKELFFKRELFARAKDGPLKDSLKADIEKYEASLEVKKLREEISTQRAQEEQRKYFENYRTNARTYVDKLDEKEAPVIAKLVKAGKSDWVMQKLIGVVSADAQERFAKGDNGDPLTAAEAIKRLEAEHAMFAEVFKAAPDKKVAKPSLSTPNSTVKAPATKVDEDDLEALFEKGYQAGVRVYHKGK